MKFQKTTTLLIFFLCAFLSNSQEKQYDVSESMFVEWIESTVDFLALYMYIFCDAAKNIFKPIV